MSDQEHSQVEDGASEHRDDEANQPEAANPDQASHAPLETNCDDDEKKSSDGVDETHVKGSDQKPEESPKIETENPSQMSTDERTSEERRPSGDRPTPATTQEANTVCERADDPGAALKKLEAVTSGPTVENDLNTSMGQPASDGEKQTAEPSAETHDATKGMLQEGADPPGKREAVTAERSPKVTEETPRRSEDKITSDKPEAKKALTAAVGADSQAAKKRPASLPLPGSSQGQKADQTTTRQSAAGDLVTEQPQAETRGAKSDTAPGVKSQPVTTQPGVGVIKEADETKGGQSGPVINQPEPSPEFQKSAPFAITENDNQQLARNDALDKKNLAQFDAPYTLGPPDDPRYRVPELRSHSTPVYCPHCKTYIMTIAKKRIGSFTIVAWLCCCLCCCTGLCSFCLDCSKDVIHTCPRCEKFIHRHIRLGTGYPYDPDYVRM